MDEISSSASAAAGILKECAAAVPRRVPAANVIDR